VENVSDRFIEKCPFCGYHTNNPLIHHNGINDTRQIECLNCKGCGPSAGTAHEAIIAWNKRTGEGEAEREKMVQKTVVPN
jgi:Lar family restriction alleviation protein